MLGSSRTIKQVIKRKSLIYERLKETVTGGGREVQDQFSRIFKYGGILWHEETGTISGTEDFDVGGRVEGLIGL